MKYVNFAVAVIGTIWFVFILDKSFMTQIYEIPLGACVAWSLGRLAGMGLEE